MTKEFCNLTGREQFGLKLVNQNFPDMEFEQENSESKTLKNPNFGPFGACFPHFRKNTSYPKESGSVNLEPLWFSKFIKNI